MIRRLLPIILLLHYFQGSGYCSAVSSLPGVYSESSPEAGLEADDHSSSNDIQPFNNSDVNLASSQHNQPTSMRQQQDVKGSTDNRRQRRHIGSIAAFRGLPGPFNKFNPVEWPLSAGWDRKGFPLSADKMSPGLSYDYMESPYGDVIKDKRYPDVTQTVYQKNNQPPNPVLMRNNPGTGSSSSSGGGNKNFEIVTPPHNEARARAVNRLLRLLSEAKANSAGVNSISKKFLGALARNNALPVSKAVVPLVQYKGSTAIPLPGKRTSISSRIPLESKDVVGDFEFANQSEDDSIDDMYSDDIAAGTEEDQIDEYDGKITSMKRNIASLAAKGGWMRPSRTYNRVPQFSF